MKTDVETGFEPLCKNAGLTRSRTDVSHARQRIRFHCERSLANAGPERAEHPGRYDCNRDARTCDALAGAKTAALTFISFFAAV